MAQKKMISLLLPVELLENVKDIVYWNPSFTMSSFLEGAIIHYIKSNNFNCEKRNGSIKRGRPLS